MNNKLKTLALVVIKKCGRQRGKDQKMQVAEFNKKENKFKEQHWVESNEFKCEYSGSYNSQCEACWEKGRFANKSNR